jgi:two-component system sensor histidine kinase UhpB
MVLVGPRGLGAVGTRRLVDGVTVGLAVALFARVADQEILLQAAWVVAGIGAVIYRFFSAVMRIVLVGAATAAYTLVSSAVGNPVEPQLIPEPPDFAEWSLMLSIGLLVAFLADRIGTVARRYAALYREASERLHTAHEQERGRLARNLHDGVGQTLTAVILTLDAAESELWAGDNPPPAHARVTMARAQALAAAALDEARGVAAELRPARIHEIGLGAALVNLARDAGVPVEVRFDQAILPPGLLGPEREIDTFRIVQEAIGNAARHSGARHLWIDARATGADITLEVGDDGRGLEVQSWNRGLGLAGMQERAAILHATFGLRSRPGKGTVVTVTVPIAPEAEAAARPATLLADAKSLP